MPVRWQNFNQKQSTNMIWNMGGTNSRVDDRWLFSHAGSLDDPSSWLWMCQGCKTHIYTLTTASPNNWPMQFGDDCIKSHPLLISMVGLGPPSNTTFLGPPRVSSQNRTSIRSAIFAGHSTWQTTDTHQATGTSVATVHISVPTNNITCF